MKAKQYILQFRKSIAPRDPTDTEVYDLAQLLSTSVRLVRKYFASTDLPLEDLLFDLADLVKQGETTIPKLERLAIKHNRALSTVRRHLTSLSPKEHKHAITEREQAAIVRKYKNTSTSMTILAKEYKTSLITIGKIIDGYKIEQPKALPEKVASDHIKSSEINDLYESGYEIDEIAIKLNLSTFYVQSMI